jgi:uncharacterized protein (DUF885 family)
MQKLIAGLFGIVFAMAAPAGAQTVADVAATFDTMLGQTDPVSAGLRGDRAALTRWPDVSPQAAMQMRASYIDLAERLKRAQSGPSDRLNKVVLERLLLEEAKDVSFHDNRLAFNNDSGFYSLAAYAASSTRLRSVADGEAWIARLNALPAFYDANIDNLRRGLRTGWTQPGLVVDAVRVQAAKIPANATESPLFAPFASLPATIPAAEAQALRAKGRAAIEEKVLPAQRKFLAFLDEEYRPGARKSLAVRDIPQGAAYYQFLAKRYTTTDLTPEQIHQIGLAEVARIRARMETAMRATGYQGDFKSFLAYLRTDPRFYAKTPEELLMRAAEIAKRADDQLPGWFATLPRLPYGVRPVPADIAPTYTTGRYFSGSPEAGIAGGYMVNTSKLDQRPLYELPALTLHEAVPGHHLQIALAQELAGLPAFRRDTSFTAFVEGWGLYAEYLGEEMGLYRDPYEMFGRLSYEMWRACRLVADTGIHWKRWDIERARACFTDNSALAPHNIQTELERYISWPGQALAYKIGEIEIRRIRAKAETALGAKFDRRQFHDALLRNGALPLSVLAAEIDLWIESQAR